MKLIRPMLATLSTEVPKGPGWVFEEKYDGIRALAYRTKEGPAVVSQSARPDRRVPGHRIGGR